ncbi:hypothetical protein WJX77_004152 [Trebouxia sp. C0004]
MDNFDALKQVVLDTVRRSETFKTAFIDITGHWLYDKHCNIKVHQGGMPFQGKGPQCNYSSLKSLVREKQRATAMVGIVNVVDGRKFKTVSVVDGLLMMWLSVVVCGSVFGLTAMLRHWKWPRWHRGIHRRWLSVMVILMAYSWVPTGGEGYIEPAQKDNFTEEAFDSVARKMTVRLQPYAVEDATLTLYNPIFEPPVHNSCCCDETKVRVSKGSACGSVMGVQ